MNKARLKKVLVTGAAGSIGSEIVIQCSETDKVFCLDNNEVGVYDLIEELRLLGRDVIGYVGDIRNSETVQDVFSSFQPDIVYHAAAYKCVTPMEMRPTEAIDVNILGTNNILKAAKFYSTKRLVYISTDKAVSMNSVMGATKKFGEILTKNAGYTVVRFGNVMGSRGSVIPFWKNQIKRGQPITITDKRCERFLMSIEDAVRLVREAGDRGGPGQIWILNMGSPFNVYDLAKKIIKESGNDPKTYPIKIIGLRPGETLTESLMTAEEKERCYTDGNFYVIK